MSNVIGVRRWRLYLAAIVLALGLSSAPALAEQAAASETHVVICNAGVSAPGVKLWVHNYYNPNGYALFPGGCNTFNRRGVCLPSGCEAGIKVNLSEAYNWRVRSVPGAYGRLFASMWSYPASKDRYDYWLNP